MMTFMTKLTPRISTEACYHLQLRVIRRHGGLTLHVHTGSTMPHGDRRRWH